MADTNAPARLDPVLHAPPADPVAELKAAVEAAPPPAAPADRPGLDQLSRIEDKASRIEEKYARSEALLQRVEDRVGKAADRMGEGARAADVATLRGEVSALDRRVRGLPGFATLLIVSLFTGAVAAGLTVAALRYGVPGILPPAVNMGGPAR